MMFRRYAFTALLSALLWLFAQWLFDRPGAGVIFGAPIIAATFMVIMAFATALSIWVVDVAMPWSSGQTSLATFGRIGIGLVAGGLFTFMMWNIVSWAVSDYALSEAMRAFYLDGFLAALIAAQVVDLLVRSYPSRPVRKRA